MTLSKCVKKHVPCILFLVIVLISTFPNASGYTLTHDPSLNLNTWKYEHEVIMNENETVFASNLTHYTSTDIETPAYNNITDTYSLLGGSGIISDLDYSINVDNSSYWNRSDVQDHQHSLTYMTKNMTQNIGVYCQNFTPSVGLQFFMYIHDDTIRNCFIGLYNDSNDLTHFINITQEDAHYYMYDEFQHKKIVNIETDRWYKIVIYEHGDDLRLHVYDKIDGVNVPLLGSSESDLGFDLVDYAVQSVTIVTSSETPYSKILSIDGFTNFTQTICHDAQGHSYMDVPSYIGEGASEMIINFNINASTLQKIYYPIESYLRPVSMFSFYVQNIFTDEYYSMDFMYIHYGTIDWVKGLYYYRNECWEMVSSTQVTDYRIVINNVDSKLQISGISHSLDSTYDANTSVLCGFLFDHTRNFMIHTFEIHTNGLMRLPQYEYDYSPLNRGDSSSITVQCSDIGSGSGIYSMSGDLEQEFKNGTHEYYVFAHSSYDSEMNFILRMCCIDGSVYEDRVITLRFNMDTTDQHQQDKLFEWFTSYWWTLVISFGTIGVVARKIDRKEKKLEHVTQKVTKRFIVGYGEVSDGCDIIDGHIHCKNDHDYIL